MKKNGLKVKGMHYPSLGMMALSGNVEERVQAALELRTSSALK